MNTKTKKMWELEDYALVNTVGIAGEGMFPPSEYGDVVGCGWTVFHKEVERPASYNSENDVFDIDWDYDYDDDVETGKWVKIFVCVTKHDAGFMVDSKSFYQDKGLSNSATREGQSGPFDEYQDAYEYGVEMAGMFDGTDGKIVLSAIFDKIMEDYS